MIKMSRQSRTVFLLFVATTLSLSFQNCSNKKFVSEMGDASLIPLEEIASASKAEIDFPLAPVRLQNNKQISIPFNIIDLAVGEKIVCRLNEIEIPDCESPVDLSNLRDGFQIFKVEIYNKKNEKVKFKSVGWTVDTTAPEIVVHLAPSEQSANATTEEIDFVARDINDPSPDLRCKWNSLDWEPCTGVKILSNLALGNHTFLIEAKDMLGNTSPIKELNWEVVDTIPSVEFVEKPLAASPDNNPLFKFRVIPVSRTDFSKFECQLAPAETVFYPCMSPKSFENISEGNYTLTVRAKTRNDLATADLIYNFTVDATPPTLSSSIVDLINGDEVYGNLNFQHTANDNVGIKALQCKVNGAAEFVDCPLNTNFNALGAGVHSIQFRAIDYAGLTSPVASFTSVYYFQTKPNIQFTTDSHTLPENKPEFENFEFAITGDNLKPLEISMTELEDLRKPGIALPLQGPTFNRFDWDYRFTTYKVTIPAGQKTGAFRIQYSMDLRDEPEEMASFGIEASPQNKFSVTGEKGSLMVTIPDFNSPAPSGEVTYSALMNRSFGILHLFCVRCHNSVDLNGGFDMTDYKKMVEKGIIKPGDLTLTNHNLFLRIDPDPNSPRPAGLKIMPLDGFMSIDRIEAIKNWLNAGAKNN